MAYANPNSHGRVSFEWDEDDVELFEDTVPAPVRERAPKSAAIAQTRLAKRARSASPAKNPFLSEPDEHPRCERCAAEARARENALPGLSKKDRISAPAEMNPGGRYLLAIFSPKMVGAAVVLLLASSFVGGVVG